jgi:hypothetical protein
LTWFQFKKINRKLDLTKLCLPENERSVNEDRKVPFPVPKKIPDLGNGRGKWKIRAEAVPFQKPKHEENLVFGFGNETRKGLRPLGRLES